MFEITLSEDLRARLDALKDIALNQWRENGVSLFSPKSMPRLHFHVQPCQIVNTNTFYGISFLCSQFQSGLHIFEQSREVPVNMIA